jgi:hypothetical protein
MKLFAPPRQSRGLVTHFNRNDTQYLEGRLPHRINPGVLGTTPALSISAWFRTDGAAIEQCLVYLGAYDKSSEHFMFGLDNGNGAIDGYTDAHHWCYTGNSYTTSVWQHVFYQFWDYSNYKVTLNGDTANSSNSGGSLADAEWSSDANNGLTVGYRNDSSPGDAFWGDLAHVTVWQGVLSDGEGVKLARGVHPLDIRPWAHVFYLPLDRKGAVDLVDGMKLTPFGTTTGPTYEGERGHLPVLKPMYKPMVWVVAGSSDGPIDLTVQNCSHSHAASAPTLTQTHVLAIQNGAHSNALTSPTIEITHILVAQDAAHNHSAENLDLVEIVNLAVQDGAHSHSAENVTLTQVHSLVVQDGAHTHLAEEPAVNTSTNLSLADASHAHVASTVTLTQVHLLAINDGWHDHDAGNVFLGEGYKEYVLGIGAVTLMNAGNGSIQQAIYADGFIDQLWEDDVYVDQLKDEESFVVQVYPDDGVIVRTHEQEASL